MNPRFVAGVLLVLGLLFATAAVVLHRDAPQFPAVEGRR